MMIRHGLLVVLLVLAAGGRTPVRAQTRDFQVWAEGSLRWEASPGLQFKAEAGQRFSHNALRYDRSLLTLSVSRSLGSHVEVAGGGRTALVREEEDGPILRYRLHGDVDGKWTAGPLDVSLRGRLQYQFGSFSEWTVDGGQGLVGRPRLTLSHHVFGTRVELEAGGEAFFRPFGPDPRKLDAWRLSGGISYALDFHSDLQLTYFRDAEVNRANPGRLYVLQLSYNRDL